MFYNINTKEYWDRRFSTGDWENNAGRQQTIAFAEEQCSRLGITTSFDGTITDFGCGLGDAIVIYKKYFPNAVLRGYDISTEAINKCREKYGSLAFFYQGTEKDVKYTDLIISSNVFEHLSYDNLILKLLLERCKYLYVAVPYNESIIKGSEHINSYDESSFPDFNKEYDIFFTNGMSQKGEQSICKIYFKNILRILFGRPLTRGCRQILFKFRGDIA